MSAKTSVDDKIKAMDLGIDDYIINRLIQGVKARIK